MKEEGKIDDLIKEALSKEEAKFYDELGEQSLIGKLGEVHKGKNWMASFSHDSYARTNILSFCLLYSSIFKY